MPPPPQVGIVNKLATSYNYQYVTIKFDFIPLTIMCKVSFFKEKL